MVHSLRSLTVNRKQSIFKETNNDNTVETEVAALNCEFRYSSDDCNVHFGCCEFKALCQLFKSQL